MPKTPCPKCGFLNPASAEYCELCQHAPLRAAQPPPSSVPTPAAPPSHAPATRRSFYAEQAGNRRLSWLLVAVFVVLLSALGGAIGEAYGSGWAGFALCVLLAAVCSSGAYLAGDRMLLAASGAIETTPEAQPQLHHVIEEMCIASGLPKPRVYILESEAPNAFATGRSPEHASIAVTTGLLKKLNREELQGVLAHEMSHIRNLDVRFAMMVGILVGMVALLCDAHLRHFRYGSSSSRRGRGGAVVMLVALVLAIFAPFASKLIQMAISRRRELLADASAVELTRNPLGLASALRKIGTDPAPLEAANRATQHLYIANPVKAAAMSSSALFSTHPPIEARIRILESMA